MMKVFNEEIAQQLAIIQKADKKIVEILEKDDTNFWAVGAKIAIIDATHDLGDHFLNGNVKEANKVMEVFHSEVSFQRLGINTKRISL